MDENELERIRRDLTWLITAPPLLNHPLSRWQPHEVFPLSLPHTIAAEHLAPLIPLRRSRLGPYFEALAGVLFDHSPEFTILARNRTIETPGRTLGELDLLLADHCNEQVLHLELALKFYLKLNQPGDMAWIGAGQRDFLALKLQRLAEHQIQLPVKARAHHCWPEELPVPDISLAWVTGRLFLPLNSNRLTPMVASDAPTGTWLTLSEFESMAFEGDWIGKGDWLGDDPVLPSEPIRHPLPGQFYGTPKGGNSRRHWFVVPDHWPESARQRMLARFYPSQENNPGV